MILDIVSLETPTVFVEHLEAEKVSVSIPLSYC